MSIIRKVTFFTLIYFLIPLGLFAQDPDYEDNFFSYERFYLQAAMLKEASESADVRGNIKLYMRNFSDGVYAIGIGDLEEAKTKLLKAHTVWPEYFVTDFLLARVSEDMKEYKLSAQFYKSYLNKLKALSEGRYRVSGPLMLQITPYPIENYNDAHRLVKYRLDYYGIDLAKVRPFYTIPGFLRFLIVVVVLGSGYAIMAYRVVPYVKKRWSIINPQEGVWVCKKCGTPNINIRKECEKCGEKK